MDRDRKICPLFTIGVSANSDRSVEDHFPWDEGYCLCWQERCEWWVSDNFTDSHECAIARIGRRKDY